VKLWNVRPSQPQVCKPNSVPEGIGTAIIHLAQLLPVGSSDLPGGRSRRSRDRTGRPVTPPYLILHREEFAWPPMSPPAPVRSYRTISPITSEIADLRPAISKGRFAFCCTCRHPESGRPAVSGLAALRCSDFPLLGTQPRKSDRIRK
jgi:hypothetical protein